MKPYRQLQCSKRRTKGLDWVSLAMGEMEDAAELDETLKIS